MNKLLVGAAALGLLAADAAAAQTVIKENRRGDTVVTHRQKDGDVVRRVYRDGSAKDRRYEQRYFSYGGRRYNAVRSRWVAPRGWAHRRYSIGAVLPSFFLSTSYYVDPVRFGLRIPRAGSNRYWVRVGNDLYLVNRGGKVLRVVPNVFYY